MNALRVLIVDDEALARMRLATLLAECREPAALLVGEAAHAAQALQQAAACQPDVALLDIALPGASGLQLAHSLRQSLPACAIVFVTAHAQHAVQAFELEAVDYLTKPVRAERLQAALRRVAQRLQPPPSDAAGAAGEVITVHDRGRLMRVPVHEVLYLKAELKYVTLRTATRQHVLDDSLGELEARLGPGFLRVHRNALVARHAVRSLQRRHLPEEPGSEAWAVQVAPVDEWLAVSRRQLAAVREALLEAGT